MWKSASFADTIDNWSHWCTTEDYKEGCQQNYRGRYFWTCTPPTDSVQSKSYWQNPWNFVALANCSSIFEHRCRHNSFVTLIGCTILNFFNSKWYKTFYSYVESSFATSHSQRNCCDTEIQLWTLEIKKFNQNLNVL